MDQDDIAHGFVDFRRRPALFVSAGDAHTCAILSNGHLQCWGEGLQGQLGYGNRGDIGDDELPSTAGSVSLGDRAIHVSAGWRYTCAVTETGEARCWGINTSDGKLGLGRSTFGGHLGDDEHPTRVPPIDLGGPAVEIHASVHHTCARMATGVIRCWGEGSSGALGYGYKNDIGDAETPSTAGDVSVF